MTEKDALNPYVGLRPFDVDESILFFGRNQQTLELLQRLHEHHFVAVVGGSGSGKSSLLRAGLIPALKAGYLVDDSDHWIIALMKPGKVPLYNLAAAFLEQINPASGPADILLLVKKINEEGADAIINILVPLRTQKNIHFFLLVDQFEELFRFAMDLQDAARKDEAIDFVNIMLELSQNPRCRVYVVTTMRSDFIGDCADFNGLPEAMNESQYLVPKLNRLQLKTVIEGPAKLYGGKINPALTSRLMNDLGKVKDELPLLQHALMRMWDFEVNVNKSGELGIEDYENIGGLEKALCIHADEALKGMDGNDLKLTKQLFQPLTAIDENGRKIRRPSLMSELERLTGATNEKITGIINRFIEDKRCFLIVTTIADSGDILIDISHESLIRQWTTLTQWVDEETENAASFSELVKSAGLHHLHKKDYLTGDELKTTTDWYRIFKPSTDWARRYTADPKIALDYLSQSIEEQQQQRRRRNAKAVFSVIAALGIIAITAYFVNRYNQGVTLKKQLAGLLQKRTAAIGKENDLQALVYSAEYLSKEKNKTGRDTIIEQSIKAKLLPAYVLKNMFLNPDEVKLASLSTDGKIIYVWLHNQTLMELNSETGAVIKSLTYEQAADTPIATSPLIRKTVLTLFDTVNNVPQQQDTVLIDSTSWFIRKNEAMLGNDASGFPNLQNVIKSLRGVYYSNDGKQILTWGENTESIYDGVNTWDQDGIPTSITMIHDGISGAASYKNNTVILTWGTDSTVRVWQYVNDTNSIRVLPPGIFKNYIEMATGVKMSPADHSISIIQPPEYIKQKEVFLKEEKPWLDKLNGK